MDVATPALRKETASKETGPSFLFHPQRLWWRAAVFQIHLWMGLVLGLYVCAVGISGSVIVLEEELTRLSRPELFVHLRDDEPQRFDSLQRTAQEVKRRFPDYEFTEILFPTQSEPALQFGGARRSDRRGGDFLTVYVDPESGRILGTTDHRFWLSRIRDLHVELMAGRPGFIANGCGATALLLLAGTGTVLWWPGIRHWTRVFRVDFRRKWSRINFDLHSAVGGWLLFFVLVWAISGIYFVWPDAFVSFLDHFTPAKLGVAPTVIVSKRLGATPPYISFLEKASTMNPGARALELELPLRPQDPLVVVLAHEETFRAATHVYFDPVTGEVLQTWTRGEGATFGAKIVPWLADLHFGERWGLGVKLLWAVLGLGLPVLAITGALMYWNRFLAKKWRHATRQPARV